MTSPKKKCENKGACHKAFEKKAQKEAAKTPKPANETCVPKPAEPKSGGCGNCKCGK